MKPRGESLTCKCKSIIIYNSDARKSAARKPGWPCESSGKKAQLLEQINHLISPAVNKSHLFNKLHTTHQSELTCTNISVGVHKEYGPSFFSQMLLQVSWVFFFIFGGHETCFGSLNDFPANWSIMAKKSYFLVFPHFFSNWVLNCLTREWKQILFPDWFVLVSSLGFPDTPISVRHGVRWIL